jgi:hypothetical protein
VTLIVYMEAMVYGMVLQFGNVTSHVDHSHPHNATGVRPKRAAEAPRPPAQPTVEGPPKLS